jgi:hypothetical protein
MMFVMMSMTLSRIRLQRTIIRLIRGDLSGDGAEENE